LSNSVVFPLRLDQGATWRHSFLWEDEDETPINLTGASARMQISAGGALLVDLTSEAGDIALGGVAGTIDITLTDEDSEALNVGRATYWLEVTMADGSVERLVHGPVSISLREVLSA
jgi:hypothetical protein